MLRHRIWLLSISAATLALSGAAMAQEAPAPGSVGAANAAFDAALLARDAAALETIYAADFVFVSDHANLRDRAQQIARQTQGEGRLVEGRSEAVEVLPLGDAAALVTGRFVGRWREGGTDTAFEERYTTVWLRIDGRWRLRHEHVSVKPEGE